MANQNNANDPQLVILGGVFVACAIVKTHPKWIGPLFWLILFCFLGGLLVLFKKLLQSRQRRLRERAILGPSSDAVFCGKTDKGESVFIKTKHRIMHTQVIGTTNAGKTESVILPWAIQDIEQGRGLLLIDGKSDRSLLEKLWAYTVKFKREKDFKLFSLSALQSSDTFNPLIGGTAEEIVERVFSAFIFENPFYRSLQYEVLSQSLRIFAGAKAIPTFARLHHAISSEGELTELAKKSNNPSLVNWAEKFSILPLKEREQRTSGLLTQISPFAFGNASPLFNAVEPEITIERALKDGNIVYFQLPVLLSPFLGSVTGKLVLQSLQAAIANRHRHTNSSRPFFSVFLDDFSEYLYPGFVSVLNKSRSANVGVVFAHQALGDIESLGGPIANAILTNSNLKIFMRGNDPNSAEHFSKIIGTTSTVRMTERKRLGWIRDTNTGDVSAREVEEFVIHPNHFKRDLGVGQAVMVVPHEGGSKTVRIQFDKYPDLPSVQLRVPSRKPDPHLKESKPEVSALDSMQLKNKEC